MLYSTNTSFLTSRDGIDLKKAVRMVIDSGFPAIDLSMINYDFVMEDNYKETAKELKDIVDFAGVIFNQAHAPFGGGYDKYSTVTAANLPRVIEFAGLIGVKNIVIHPLQKIRYYGREEEMFELNMEFYSKLGVHAKNSGVKIAIENMWQNHPVNNYIVDDIGADPRELCRYYDTLNDPEAFTVCLDIGHVGLCGREPEDAVRIIGHDRLGSIHAHDVDYVNDLHTLPGLSKLNWENICQALGEINYIGDFTLESQLFAKGYPTEHLPNVLRFMAETAKLYSDKIDYYRKKV